MQAVCRRHDRLCWIQWLHTNAVVARPNGAGTHSFDGAVDLQRDPCLQGKPHIGIREFEQARDLSLV